MSEHKVETLRHRWLQESKDNDLGLWWFAEDIREYLAPGTDEEVRTQTLGAIRPLLASGQLHAVDLLPNGEYQLWGGDVEGQLRRIDEEWRSLGHPPSIGDIVWFIGSNRGHRARVGFI